MRLFQWLNPSSGVVPAICIAVAISACSTAQRPRVPVPKVPGAVDIPADASYKVGSPYQVAGVWYYPAENYSYVEEGIASWYGPDFHGKRTANGERFDMNALTAAHPTLPLPSIVNVTNLENGRMVKLRINDRGPFKSQRIIDVSRRAAQLLGFQEKGTTRVRIQVDPSESLAIKNLLIAKNPGAMPQIASAPRAGVRAEPLTPPLQVPSSSSSGAVGKPPPVTQSRLPPLAAQPASVASAPVQLPAGTGIYIQAGAFGETGNALRLEQQLQEFGHAFIVPTMVDGRQLFRVRLGPLQDAAGAEELLATIKSYGYSDAIIVKY
ncbi:MAG: septal ring lytic transglycosylase RlpA family protein [Rhodobacteraceae bacterium]|nr:septal ring lytic transglycosylase RlpA family protein [Paracoccaceae bacterium]